MPNHSLSVNGLSPWAQTPGGSSVAAHQFPPPPPEALRPPMPPLFAFASPPVGGVSAHRLAAHPVASPSPGFAFASSTTHSPLVGRPLARAEEGRSSSTPGGSPSPRSSSSRASFALPYSREHSFAEDVGDFRLSGTFKALIPDWSPETKEQDERVRRQFMQYCVEKMGTTNIRPPLYDNLRILAFLTSKIDKAKAAIAAGLEATLSAVSLNDRYLASVRRLQLVEERGQPNAAAFEEVKKEVLSRAKEAQLPLVSKGTDACFVLSRAHNIF
jgi:hypothetical protein